MAVVVSPNGYVPYVLIEDGDTTATVIHVATGGSCYTDTADGRKYHVALPSARCHEDSQFMLERELDEFFAGVAVMSR